MNLWLDDVRDPAEFGCIGWRWVKTVDEAKAALATGKVVKCSLDHDLGACPVCLDGKTEAQWLDEHDYQSMPNCNHFGTGYDLVCWMEECEIWPQEKPTVHSANPVGARRMRAAIDRKWEAEQAHQQKGQ